MQPAKRCAGEGELVFGPTHHGGMLSGVIGVSRLRLTITDLKEAHAKFYPREKESGAL